MNAERGDVNVCVCVCNVSNGGVHMSIWGGDGGSKFMYGDQ